MSWITPQQAERLAPDSGTLDRARKIAKRSKYQNIGASERALWGVALGSSRYDSFVDLQGPTYKCSCPVNKQPCKHVMGLMLLIANEPACVTETEPGTGLQEWLAKRDSSAQAKATKAAQKASGEGVADSAAQARRAAERERQVDQGIGELLQFLEDLVSTGLIEAGKRSGDGWDNMRRRLVDAKAPGLAGMLDGIHDLSLKGRNSHQQLLADISGLYNLCCAWKQQAQLPAAQVDDLRMRIGWNKTRDEVLASTRHDGRWLVLNQQIKPSERDPEMTIQQIWLLEQASGKTAQLINIATPFSSDALHKGLESGKFIQAGLAYYSQWAPQRAVLPPLGLHNQQAMADASWISAFASDSIHAALHQLQQQRLRQPWPGQWPLLLRNVHLVMKASQLAIMDEHRHLMLLDDADLASWQLPSVMGSDPVTLFGVCRDGMTLQPWGCVNGQQWHTFDLNRGRSQW